MKKHRDFAKMNAKKNPYAAELKKQVTIRLGKDVIAYFKDMSEETGIPYQTLIDMYLRHCAVTGKKLTIDWDSAA